MDSCFQYKRSSSRTVNLRHETVFKLPREYIDPISGNRIRCHFLTTSYRITRYGNFSLHLKGIFVMFVCVWLAVQKYIRAFLKLLKTLQVRSYRMVLYSTLLTKIVCKVQYHYYNNEGLNALSYIMHYLTSIQHAICGIT